MAAFRAHAHHPVPAERKLKRHRGVWQRKFREHTIRDTKGFHMHFDYIHLNPVKHSLISRPGDWPWSSFRRCVKRGWYDADWCGRIDLAGNIEYAWLE